MDLTPSHITSGGAAPHGTFFNFPPIDGKNSNNNKNNIESSFPMVPFEFVNLFTNENLKNCPKISVPPDIIKVSRSRNMKIIKIYHLNN